MRRLMAAWAHPVLTKCSPSSLPSGGGQDKVGARQGFQTTASRRVLPYRYDPIAPGIVSACRDACHTPANVTQ